MLRVEVGCSLQLYRMYAQTVFEPGAVEPRLQLRRRQYPMRLELEAGEKLFAIEEEVELPVSRPEPNRILHCNAQPHVSDLRLAGNRVVFKGTVIFQVLYETTDGQIERWDGQLPFSQFVDFQTSYEEESCSLQLQLCGCEVTGGQNGARHITYHLMLLAQCMVHGYRTLEIIDDAYWLGGSMEAKVAPCSIRCQLDQQELNQTVYLEAPTKMYLVLDTQVYLGRPEITQSDSHTNIRVPVCVAAYGTDTDGKPCGTIAKTYAEFSQNAAPQSQCHAHASVSGEVYATPGAERLQVRFDVTLQCQWNALCCFESISGGSVQEITHTPGSRPSVILRTLGRDTSVWDLAKACNTTQETLCRANDLQEDVVQAGTLLLMPLG